MVEPGNTVTQDLRTTLQSAAAGSGDGLRRGLWLSFLDPYGLEVATDCGADWIGVDLQHGNFEPHDLPGLCASPNPQESPAGPHALPRPRITLPDPGRRGERRHRPHGGVGRPSRAIVSACRTPPFGARSTGGCRSTLGVTRAPAQQLVLPMVETATGLDHAADILAVPGVDGSFFLRPLRPLKLRRLLRRELTPNHPRTPRRHQPRPSSQQDRGVHGRET